MPSSSEQTLLDESDTQIETASPKAPLRDSQTTSPSHYNVVVRLAKWYWNNCFLVMSSAACFIAIASLSVKVLIDDISIFQICVVRAMLSLPVLLPFSYYQSGMVFGPKDNLVKIVLRGVLCAVGYILMGITLMLLPLSYSALLNNIHPVFVALIAWWIGAQKIDARVILAVLGTLLAMVFIAKPPFIFGGNDNISTSKWIGILLCVVGSFVRGSGFVLIGKIDKKVPSLVIANHAMFYLVLFSVPFLILSFPDKVKLDLSGYQILYLIGCTAASLNQILIVRGFQIATPVQGAIMILVRVLSTSVAGIIFLSEKLTIYLCIGTVLLLGSLAVVSMPQKKKEEAELPINSSIEEDEQTIANVESLRKDRLSLDSI